MSEPADAAGAARLDELAAVTREYARYSNTLFGLAHTVTGAWYVASFVIAMRSETWGRIAALWSPLLAFGALALGKRYYQRFGQVIEPAAVSGVTWLRTLSEWTAVFLVANTIFMAARHLDDWTSPDSLASYAVLFALWSLPFVILLISRARVGTVYEMGAGLSLFSMYSVATFTGPRLGWTWAKGMMGIIAITGAYVALLGVREHLRYRRLERRLAALRVRA